MSAFGVKTGSVYTTTSGSYGLVRDNSGPDVIDNDPAAIVTKLRQEMDRIRMTYDTGCIWVVSPDGEKSEAAMEAFRKRFAAKLRSYDAICRFAPDKFLVMLPHVNRENAVQVIKRLRTEVISEPLTIDDGRKIKVTASFGGTMLDSKALLNEHVDRASEAHSWALKGRGDSICMWTPQL